MRYTKIVIHVNVVFLFLLFCCLSCKESKKIKQSGEISSEKNLEDQNNLEDESATLGVIDINVTCSKDAFPAFQQGLLFLHSFQFDDAGDKFLEAQGIDSTCAMAYWGEAMSKNHPLWREQDKGEAKEILQRLGQTVSVQRGKFKTDFEKDMFDAISILYGEGTKKENDKAYSSFMEKLNNKYPDNHEVRAFYALSLLGAVEDDRQEELYEKGAKIAQSIIDENAHHPGALHYLIHSYDDPKNAHKALNAANRYAKVAPDAAHALHMPSHIYVALGMWDEVISSNIAAVKASISRKERKNLKNKAIDFHSLKWQMYAHLQKGQFEEAKKLVNQMQKYCEEEQSPKAVSHNVMMKAAYMTETNQWEDTLIHDKVEYNDLPIQIFGTRNFMLGMEAFQNKDQEALLEIIHDMNPEIVAAKKDALIGSSSMCSGSYDRKRPTENNVIRTEVMQTQLKALHAMMEDDDIKAEEFLKSAIEKEKTTTFLYGPPEIVKPTYEMYADWLIDRGRNEEALDYYEKVLERAPGRYIPTQAINKLKKVG